MAAQQPETLDRHIRSLHDRQRPALETNALTLTYGDLIQLVDTAAALLTAAGVGPGGRVVVTMPNSAEQIIAVLAANAIDATVIPFDPGAGNSRLADIASQTSPRLCITMPGQNALPGIQTLRLRINPDRRTLGHSMEQAAAGITPTALRQEPAGFIRFTSGSTGHAKGVMLGHRQQFWTARMLAECFRLNAEHRELMLVSMALSGGWQRVAATLYAGGSIIIVDKPLSVGDLLDAFDEHRATGFFTPPPLVRMILSSPAEKAGRALQACTTIEIGSAAVSAGELRALGALLPAARIYVHYGLTECSRAFILDTGSHADKLSTVGRPAPGVEIRIVNDHGQEVSANQLGQILLRGPQMTRGYWQQPALNRQRFIDGWLATGDYGMLDEDGFLTLQGRHDDLINCGGHCYFPDEVERVMGIPQGVQQYLIAAVPDPRGILQQIPWAFVVPLNANSWSPVGFLAMARKRLPPHMVPRRVVVVPGLVLTPSGKPDRRATAKLYASDTEFA